MYRERERERERDLPCSDVQREKERKKEKDLQSRTLLHLVQVGNLVKGRLGHLDAVERALRLHPAIAEREKACPSSATKKEICQAIRGTTPGGHIDRVSPHICAQKRDKQECED